MNQGLLIIVLLLLVLLLSCKAFNYCILRELFVNKETVKQMMDDIYGVENFASKDECDLKKDFMTEAWYEAECKNDNFVGAAPKKNQCGYSKTESENFQNIENFQDVIGYCDHPNEEIMKERRSAGKCPEVTEGFQGLPKCKTLHKASRERARSAEECEGFQNVPDRCCSPEEINNGARVNYDCTSICEGFDNYCPFKEDFLNIETVPPVNVDLIRPPGGATFD